MVPNRSMLAVGALCCAVLLGGCRRGGDDDVAVPDDTLQAGAQVALSDGEVVQAVLVAAEVGGATAAQASATAQHADVERFAQVLRADQTALQQAFAELAGRGGVQPVESEVSQELRTVGERVSQRMQNLSGRAFDDAFLQGEIEFYQTLVDALDSRLLASARNDELRGMLRDARPTYEAHLQRAMQLRSLLAHAPEAQQQTGTGATMPGQTPPPAQGTTPPPPAQPPPPVRQDTLQVRRDTLQVRRDTLEARQDRPGA
jgi:putative membrane protein